MRQYTKISVKMPSLKIETSKQKGNNYKADINFLVVGDEKTYNLSVVFNSENEECSITGKKLPELSHRQMLTVVNKALQQIINENDLGIKYFTGRIIYKLNGEVYTDPNKAEIADKIAKSKKSGKKETGKKEVKKTKKVKETKEKPSTKKDASKKLKKVKEQEVAEPEQEQKVKKSKKLKKVPAKESKKPVTKRKPIIIKNKK